MTTPTTITINNDTLFNTLPFDILSHIFSYLTKTESLRCMLVCKTWYADLPQYTKLVWRTLKIRGNVSYFKQSRTWLKFIGLHVKGRVNGIDKMTRKKSSRFI
ncbi:hypothetical protein BDA99DRAFT_1784 [Phascolomyces articulosus]|uniref:F-box domain-containing protein n=1 Tax=Phascolomyces articulosus TaxID=60185 RepID=A0AAD5KQN1_9FUNG|nr:hypothetical protein BDA99DRAFT_1784 [Phascolomyces articulosus]